MNASNFVGSSQSPSDDSEFMGRTANDITEPGALSGRMAGEISDAPTNGVSLAEPVSRTNRTVLSVPHEMARYAKLHGAVFDKREQVWVAFGEIPSELANFLPRAPRPEARRLPAPICPRCGSHMNRTPSRQRIEFWGCSAYWRTGCNGAISLEEHLDQLDRPIAPTALDVLAEPSAAERSVARPQPPAAAATVLPEDVVQSVREIAELARSMFGTNAAAWFEQRKVGLGGESPTKLLRTAEGRRRVLGLLLSLRNYD